jgi:hypothetical protein
MIRRILAMTLAAAALPAAAQSVPTTNYTDLWDNSATESGWGLTLVQHSPSNQVFAVWYTYDPRTASATTPGSFEPLWIVIPGGRWTSPTQFTGDALVTAGTPFSQAWGFPNGVPFTKIGTVTFNFTSNSTGTFHYEIAPPPGLASTDPAFGIPAFSGTKPITRNPGF